MFYSQNDILKTKDSYNNKGYDMKGRMLLELRVPVGFPKRCLRITIAKNWAILI